MDIWCSGVDSTLRDMRVKEGFGNNRDVDDDSPVLVATRNQRMYLTLNRPHVLNAHNQPMREALVTALDQFQEDDELRVAILTGAGRAFSAGADIREMDEQVPNEGGRPELGVTRMHFDRVWTLDKPIIAAMHGFAVGGGFELAQLCDVRIATRDALLGQPEPRNTGGPGSFALQHLHRLVGRGEAMLIHLTGRPITGERAYQVGLVQRLVDDHDALLAEADDLADAMVECSPLALAQIKQTLRGSIDLLIAQQDAIARQMPDRWSAADNAARRAKFLQG